MNRTGITIYDWTPAVLSILRIAVGLLFIEHGTMKLFDVPPSDREGPLPLFPGQISAVIELVGGALMIVGLWTRPVAFILSGEMAVAYFYAHMPQGFWPINNGGELAAVYAFVFLYFAFAGAGPWSLDAVVKSG